MFLFLVLGLSFEGVRDSLLLHICCCLVFGTQPSLGPTCLLCLHSLDSLSSLFELFLFFVFLLVWRFCYGFWFVSCQFLSSSWDCLSLIKLLNVLSARLCMGGFLGCLLRGTITESGLDMANREGSIYFSGFLIIGVFG